jgi:hypothetical protein
MIFSNKKPAQGGSEKQGVVTRNAAGRRRKLHPGSIPQAHALIGWAGQIRQDDNNAIPERLRLLNTVPEGVPGTFALKVGVLETGITEEMYQELERLIDDAKPVTRHLTGLAISLETQGNLDISVSLYDGDEIDVYPPVMRDIEVTGSFGVVGREHTIDTLDVYYD